MTDAQNQIIGLLKEIKAATGGGGGAVNWGAILGTLGDQTDLANALALKQTEAQVQALIDAALPYKVYTALLTQTGTDAPVAMVLQNTLGGSVVWTRAGAGDYVGTLLGAFPVNKTPSFQRVINLTPPANLGQIFFMYLSRLDDNSVSLQTSAGADFTDDMLAATFIEIPVYQL